MRNFTRVHSAPTLAPTVSPAPTLVPSAEPTLGPTVSWLVDEGVADPTIGTGWSAEGVTEIPDYGYVHGSCTQCAYGLFGNGGGAAKSWSSLPGHTHAKLSVRVWSDTRAVSSGSEDSCSGEWQVWKTFGTPGYPVCHGGGHSTCYIDVDITVAHTTDTITFSFGSNLDSPKGCLDESFGFSAFLLEVI